MHEGGGGTRIMPSAKATLNNKLHEYFHALTLPMIELGMHPRAVDMVHTLYTGY